MIRNFLLVTIRGLLRSATFASVNILGLATGLACTILIMLWVLDELSFNAFIPKHDRIYQLFVNTTFEGKVMSWNSVPLPTYEALQSQSGVADVAAMTTRKEVLLSIKKDDEFHSVIRSGYYASEEFFRMFELPFVGTPPAKPFLRPDEIVITESTAKALFGEEPAVGAIVQVDNGHLLNVVGILKDLPQNSTLQFDLLLPWRLYETFGEAKASRDHWGNDAFQIFVELGENVTRADIEPAIKDLPESQGPTGYNRTLFLYPISDLHLYSRFENGKPAGGMIEYVRLFSAVAVFILVIACINFMSLSTARAGRRAREVGIRKSVGSSRKELIWQFVGESTLVACIAYGLAIAFVAISLPFYNQLVDKTLTLNPVDPRFLMLSVGLIAFAGLLSGSYPAFYLSSFRPIKALKAQLSANTERGTLRQVLVVTQFGFSIVLIMATIVMREQIELLKNRDLGYDQENLLSVKNTRELANEYYALKQDLLAVPEVLSVTQSNSAITSLRSKTSVDWPGKPEDLNIIFSAVYAGYDYAKTMGIGFTEGRDFSQAFPGDSLSVVVNQRAVEIMGLSDPVGTRVEIWDRPYTVIGIMENVVMEDPSDEVAPLFMVLQPDEAGVISIRLDRNIDLPGALETLKAAFRKYSPAYAFDYEFADDEFDRKFASVNLVGNLAGIFALLAILITGLGLFGLATFTAERRTKEISIRKVLGASVSGLVTMISKDFTRFVIIANVIFLPVSWWLLDDFLQRYSYRTEIPWSGFLLAAVITLAFTIIIVASRVLGIARANLVELLRTE